MRKFVVLRDDVPIGEYQNLNEALNALFGSINDAANELNEITEEKLDMLMSTWTGKYQIQIEKEW